MAEPFTFITVEDLFREHRAYLVRVAIAEGLSHADAEDAVQDVFEMALGRYDALHPGRAKTWLRRAVHYQVLDMVTRRRPQLVGYAEEFADRPDNVEETMVNAGLSMGDPDTALYVMAALAELPPSRRKALEMWAFQGMNAREIAAEMGIGVPSAETYLNLGLRALRLH